MLRGEAHPMHKLTEEQILQIRELYKIGHRNINVIARNYKVSPANIKKIVTNKTWTHMLKWPYENICLDGVPPPQIRSSSNAEVSPCFCTNQQIDTTLKNDTTQQTTNPSTYCLSTWQERTMTITAHTDIYSAGQRFQIISPQPTKFGKSMNFNTAIN